MRADSHKRAECSFDRIQYALQSGWHHSATFVAVTPSSAPIWHGGTNLQWRRNAARRSLEAQELVSSNSEHRAVIIQRVGWMFGSYVRGYARLSFDG